MGKTVAFYESLINLPPVLDFEASSLDVDNSYPIALGLVVGGHSYEWLIQPKPEWTDWSERSERVHGMERGVLVRDGLATGLVCEQVNQLLGNRRQIYSDAHTWDGLWARRLGLVNLAVLHAADLLPPANVARLGELQHAARQQNNLRQHSAMDDALALAFALQTLQ